MKTELSFLLELLLHHDLPKPTKDLLATRIEEVEARITSPQSSGAGSHGNFAANPLPPHLAKQAPSTLALMAKHGDLTQVEALPMPPIPAPEPVANVAQTPATAAAMSSRASMINAAISGKPPMKNRKFK